MDVRLALVLLCFILAVMIQSSDCGKRNRVIIHVPYKIKNVKHLHTVYKTIHIHKHPEKHEVHEAHEAQEAHEEEPEEHEEIEVEAEEHEHEHFHHHHIHKVDKLGKIIPPSKHKKY